MLFSLALQLLQLLGLGLLCPQMGAASIPTIAVVLSIMLQLVQCGVVIFGLIRTVRAVVSHTVVIGKVWQMYVLQVLSFSGLYTLLYLLYAWNPSTTLYAFDAAEGIDLVVMFVFPFLFVICLFSHIGGVELLRANRVLSIFELRRAEFCRLWRHRAHSILCGIICEHANVAWCSVRSNYHLAG